MMREREPSSGSLSSGGDLLRNIADAARLAAIDRLELHGHLGDPHLDAIVATVAAACDVPMAVVNIVTPDHQTYLAEIGVNACSTDVSDELSFCAEVVRTGRAIAVEDATSHAVYSSNPLVLAGALRAYAGEPLTYGDHVIGALSIFDSRARTFTTRELAVLRAQAGLVVAALQLREFAARDPLTGLRSRAPLLELVQRSLDARVADHVVPLLVVDVVGMGRLNGALGTAGGDLFLQAVADRLTRACGAADVVARIGGDEFAVLLADVESVEHAEARADALCMAVRGPLMVQGRQVEIEVRCGLSTLSASTADELLAAAEGATGEQPPTDVGRRVPPSPEVDELARAIDGGQLVLHYHPIIELGTDQISGVEALVRWQHPTRGLLMPADFIPLAEDSGLIVQLGEWVLRTGGAQAAAWVAQGRPLDVAINLSPLQMSTFGFAGRCGALLAAVQAPLQQIILEVTESALLDQPEAAQDLRDLRSTGVRLALDDFGTGYSSFSYLRRFPIDIVKIDRSFVAGIGQHPDDEAIVASVAGLARTTGKSVVAEGVETPHQLAHLRALGVQSAQGFLWTRPLPVPALEQWFVQGHPRGVVPLPVPVTEAGRIQQMHAEGASVHTIAAALNVMGSRAGAGLRWHPRSVARVIYGERPARPGPGAASKRA